jgi:tetratricopeptide (TPR) repeat protein
MHLMLLLLHCLLTQRAAAHRARGNSQFVCGRLREATEAYSAAIDLLTLRSQDEATRIATESKDVQDACGGDEEAAKQLCACLANRAACWLRRKQWAKAMADCNAVLRAGRPHDEVTIKALFRRAKAHEGLGDADSAQADFKRVLDLQPNNVDAAEQLEMYCSVLHRIVIMSNGSEDMRRRQKGGL